MIDIIILAEQYGLDYTLASLLKKSDNYRVHIFVRPPLRDEIEPELQWALKNFRELYIYQTPFNRKGEDSHRLSRVINQFKEHWKDKQPKGLPIERVIVTVAGCRIFTGDLARDVPTVKQMGNKVAYFAREFKYAKHPTYGNYYNLIGIEEYNAENVDPYFMMLNWTKFKEIMHDQRLWFPNGMAKRYPDQTDKDSYLLSTRDNIFIPRIRSNYEWGWMPLYFDGRVDKLIKIEAIGAKDCINHNIMMRKSFSLCVPVLDLALAYENYPTLWSMAVPWDCWANVIDEIPMSIRKQGLNEQILIKSAKQKKHLAAVVKAGYLLGKV